MYFHTWELDPEQPRISAGGRITQLRHYRNLNKMKWVLEDYLSQYRFGSVAEVMGLETFMPAPHRACLGGSRASALLQTDTSETASAKAREPLGQAQWGEDIVATPITVVIPCYNEEASLPYLSRTLEQLEFALAPRFQTQYLFVDDGSQDSTWDLLHSMFAQKTNCRFIKQPQNGGVSKAILTGIEAAETDIVCSMDCDCSYDPLELKKMLPLLTDGVDLVTASPYHPAGRVKNVPSWRLGLSKGLSFLYRSFLPQPLHTWTSCFRVYRRSAIVGLPLREGGFLGTAELAGMLSLNGSRIVEHPATLSVRIFGESKMKTVRTIRGHLRLLRQLFVARLKLTRSVSEGERSANVTRSVSEGGRSQE